MQFSMDKYKILKKLGEGGFSEVFRVQHLVNGKFYAMKILKVSVNTNVADNELAAFKSLLYHENVVQCNEVIETRDVGLTFIMEYCALGSLDEFFVRYNPGHNLRQAFLQTIASGVAHLHRNNLIYRDLKPANIFITGTPSSPTAKIGDFGLAKFSSDAFKGSLYEFYMSTLAGTIFFLAPEVNDGHYTAKSDVFSMGLIFAAIICYASSQHPVLVVAIVIDGQLIAPAEALRNNFDLNVLMSPSMPISGEVDILIKAMLRKQPGRRPTADEVEKVLWKSGVASNSCILF